MHTKLIKFYLLSLTISMGLSAGKNNTSTTPQLNGDTLAAIIKAAHSYQEIEEYIPAITQHLEEEYQCHGHGQLPLTTAITDMQHSNNPAMVTMSQTVKNAVLFKTADWSMTGNNALLRGCLINKHIGNNLGAFLLIINQVRNRTKAVKLTTQDIKEAEKIYNIRQHNTIHEIMKICASLTGCEKEQVNRIIDIKKLFTTQIKMTSYNCLQMTSENFKILKKHGKDILIFIGLYTVLGAIFTELCSRRQQALCAV